MEQDKIYQKQSRIWPIEKLVVGKGFVLWVPIVPRSKPYSFSFPTRTEALGTDMDMDEV